MQIENSNCPNCVWLLKLKQNELNTNDIQIFNSNDSLHHIHALISALACLHENHIEKDIKEMVEEIKMNNSED